VPGLSPFQGTVGVDRGPFTAGTELVVIGAQTSGGSLSTEYQGTSPTVHRVRLTIVQLG